VSGEDKLQVKVSGRAAGWRSRVGQLAGQVFRFGMIGGLAFGIDAAVLSGLVALGLTPFVGRIGSIGVAIVFTWLMNRRLTFKVEAPPSWTEFGHYVAISLMGASINYLVFSAATLAKAPMLLALALGTACAMGFNFVRYRALLASRDAQPA
jgi:putative flippase GtrA